MDKETAAKAVENSGAGIYEIAESIYRAAVLGESGARQAEGGYGYLLSAIAVLWNIRGTMANPYTGKTKITGRYRGKGITQDMILDVVSRYPKGIWGEEPLFDNLVMQPAGQPQFGQSQGNMAGGAKQNTNESAPMPEPLAYLILAAGLAVFLILKFMYGWRWWTALLMTFLIVGICGSIFMLVAEKMNEWKNR